MASGICLKVLVDKKKNKVVFAECDHDFVDVLFSFLTMPIGTIMRVASIKSLTVGIGCMSNLYKSIENIDVQHFRNQACRTMLLSPRNGAESHWKKLKLKIDDAEASMFFVCSSSECTTSKFKLLSYYSYVPCDCGASMYHGIYLSETSSVNGGVFVKATDRFIVSDDLQVMLLCTATSFSLLSKCGVKDGSTIEERTFTLGVNEVLSLLICSLVSSTPLTETLLKQKPVPELNNVGLYNQGRSAKSQVEKQMMGEDQSMHIKLKLFVSKSRKMVCYAEAKKDFVNLLVSLLTVPLGHIVKQVYDSSLKGCLDHLYKSLQDLDEQCFRSNDHKEILVAPRVAPGFSYENDLLGIQEAPHQWYYYQDRYGHKNLDANKTLCPYLGIGPIPLRIVHSKSHDKEEKSCGGFLLGPNLFTVTDNLIIKPISPILGLSILNELKVPFGDIEERTVHVGKEEALSLLLSSFVSESALTNAFIKDPTQRQW
ncbi:hypothetical protein TorRG33x02_277950 [Trema orientale]|uniref:DUF674 family protein n=1 Tax=Trema orientale TaxID=63057 RepID=A0A2P5CNZ9_TREOI|nr:hypothetical protein TorRG33x02_277950 [Trema orientale]